MLEKKKVLGRGLEALIGKVREEAPKAPASSEQAAEGAREEAGDKRFFYSPVANIQPNTRQPRKSFEKAALKELSDSIVEKGIIEPLVVRTDPATNKLELIAGERRLRAARLAGLKEVPVVIIEATDEESLELAIIENIQREDLNAMEEAEAYRHLMGFGLSQAEVAFRVGKGRATVANYMRLLGLPDEVKDAIRENSVSMGHARAILSLETRAARLGLLTQIISKGLSVRDAEQLARRGGVKKPRSSLPAVDPAIKGLEDELCRVFATRIHVKEKKGKGSIEILYFSSEERERIIELLRSVEE